MKKVNSYTRIKNGKLEVVSEHTKGDGVKQNFGTGLFDDPSELMGKAPAEEINFEPKPFYSSERVDSAFGYEQHKTEFGTFKVKTTYINELLKDKPDLKLMREIAEHPKAQHNKAYQFYIVTAHNCPADLFTRWKDVPEFHSEAMARFAIRFYSGKENIQNDMAFMNSLNQQDIAFMLTRLGSKPTISGVYTLEKRFGIWTKDLSFEYKKAVEGLPEPKNKSEEMALEYLKEQVSMYQFLRGNFPNFKKISNE